ncbi:MAG: phospho-sugar mutase [Deltaproteobacteria bacterium]|nr:phospho-sugar mutase [Deltaproteobacteria bacterium]
MEELKKAEQAFKGQGAADEIKAAALGNLKAWLEDPRLVDYRPYIRNLVDGGRFALLLDCFWRMMPFGTGGRRGPVGAGPNRINPFTIALSVQGHCEYLKEIFPGERDLKVVVAYDVRCFYDLRGLYKGVKGVLDALSSRDLARTAAMTYAANGVTAFVVGALADEPGRPACSDRYISTPELSFLIRELGGVGGLNVSASHNHPDDNGGKFYNRHGGQEIPPHDEKLLGVVERVTDVRSMPYAQARDKGLIRFVPAELHESYIAMNEALCPTRSRSARVAFTPLCGTGLTTVKETLDRLGFQVFAVPEQSKYDGSFASVRYRIGNPEVPESMDRLAEVAREHGCDAGFATDPDADRLGLVVPDGKGGFAFVNGNEIGVALTESIFSAVRRKGTPARPIFINTVVTTDLQRIIARRYGGQVVGDLMVGFKYHGDVLGKLEEHGRFPAAAAAAGQDRVEGALADFAFATEESHGYLLTPRVRDKDACGAAVHLAGLASRLKDEGRTFLGFLRDIYRVYGYHRAVVRSLVMEGITGLTRIRTIQDRLRAAPPTRVGEFAVTRFVDFHKVGGPLKSSTDEASRNVLLFLLDGGEGRTIRLVIRPSGTEPKTKIYVEVPSPAPLACTLDEARSADLAQVTDLALDRLMTETDALATRVGNAFMRFCLGPEVLGDAYGEVPEESFLVSDLVPVDSKLGLCTAVLPAMVDGLATGRTDAEIRAALEAALKPFGEQPLGLVRKAALAWIDRASVEGRLAAALATRARALFAT